MRSRTSTLIFIALFSAVLNGCAPLSPNYAPVSTHAPEIAKKETPYQKQIQYHLVKKGETLYAISLLFDLDYRQLAQWNRIAPPYTLEIGQKIRVSEPNSDHQNGNDPAIIETEHHEPLPTHGAQTAIPSKTAATRLNSAPKTAAGLNNLTSQLPSKNPPVKNTTDKDGSSSQKKSTISIDNENMLKLNFQWPIKGKVLKTFSKADNKGIDIASEQGQNVSAAEAGKVVYSGQGLIGYGQLLIIKHNDLYLSAYANNSQLLITEGNAVEKGQIIAKVGHAGSNHASLHFEIRKNGKPVNPLNLLPENQ